MMLMQSYIISHNLCDDTDSDASEMALVSLFVCLGLRSAFMVVTSSEAGLIKKTCVLRLTGNLQDTKWVWLSLLMAGQIKLCHRPCKWSHTTVEFFKSG